MVRSGIFLSRNLKPFIDNFRGRDYAARIYNS